jgi:hypothetical protein
LSENESILALGTQSDLPGSPDDEQPSGVVGAERRQLDIVERHAICVGLCKFDLPREHGADRPGPGNRPGRRYDEFLAIEPFIPIPRLLAASKSVDNSRSSGLPVGEIHAPFDLGIAAGDDFLEYRFIFVVIDIYFVDAKSCSLRLYPLIVAAKRAGRHDAGRLGADQETIRAISDSRDTNARVDAIFRSRSQADIQRK